MANTKTKKTEPKKAKKPVKAAKPAVVKPVAKVAPKPQQKETVAETKNTASKAVTAAINKTVKGLDNDTSSILKAQSVLNDKSTKMQTTVSSLSKLLGGLSNVNVAAISTTQPPKAKPAPQKEEAAPEDSKPVASEETSKVEIIKTDASKVNAGSKPPLKNCIEKVLGSHSATPFTAAVIYNEITKSFGSYSRQSLYNALKDEKRFVKTGEGAEATYSLKLVGESGVVNGAVSDDEAEDLIKRMESNSAPLSDMI